jgi:Zn-dependent alcohol dehydrogenase
VTTKAAVLRAFREPQRVERLELRDPGRGEVLVRIVCAGVCHSDVGQADGEWAHPLPVVLGHEGSGVVEAVGPRVTDVQPGQRAVLDMAPGCGTCRHCLAARPILCQDALEAMGAGRLLGAPTPFSLGGDPVATYALLGCYAERAVVSERSIVPLPEGVPADVAALVGCAVVTGVGAAIETIDVAAGSRGAVVGAGGVGVNAIQGARIRGAAEIAAIDPSSSRREQAGRFGATSGLDPTDEDAVAGLRWAAPRHGFDWAIVTVGATDAIRLGIDITRPGGVICVVGLTREGAETSIDMLDVVTYEKTIRGSAYGTISARLLMPRIFDLYLQGRLLLDELVSHRFPLEQVNEAFDLSRGAGGLRAVLTVSNGGRFD